MSEVAVSAYTSDPQRNSGRGEPKARDHDAGNTGPGRADTGILRALARAAQRFPYLRKGPC